jgi:membrane-associated protease RseP (regulator of RpoE activity)
MDWYLLSVIVFIIIFALIVYRDRKKWRRESVVLLRKTRKGKHFLSRLGMGFPRFWLVAGGIGVIVGLIMSVYTFYMLIDLLRVNIFVERMPGLALVLPSPTSDLVVAPGVIGVPFWYWIIAIALLVVVHEGLHGIMSERENVKIKSLGVGLLAVIPLAFVELNEKKLGKKKTWQQLRVFAAGSFANFILAGASVLIILTLSAAFFFPSGVAYQGLLKDYPAAEVNLTGVITGIDSHMIKNQDDLNRALTETGPGRTVTVFTKVIKAGGAENRSFRLTTAEEPEPEFVPDASTGIIAGLEHAIPGTIEFSQGMSPLLGGGQKSWKSVMLEIKYWEYISGNYPSLESKAGAKIAALGEELEGYQRKGFIGIYFSQGASPDYMEVKAEFRQYSEFIGFLTGLLFFVFLINLGVGAFNLLPLGPLDGGRMWQVIFERYMPKHSKSAFKALSYASLFLIVANLALVFSGAL